MARPRLAGVSRIWGQRLNELHTLRARLERGEITRRQYRLAIAEAQRASLVSRRVRALTELDELGISAAAVSGASRSADIFGTGRERLQGQRRDWVETERLSDDEPLTAADLEEGAIAAGFGIDDGSSFMAAGSPDGMVQSPNYRSANAIKALRRIATFTPDVSLAVSTAKRVAMTDLELTAYTIGPDGPTEDVDEEATAELRRFARRIMPYHGGGGIEAMLSVGLDSLIVDGGVSYELDVAKGLDDVRDIVAVDVTKVRFKVGDVDGQTVIRPFWQSSGEGGFSGGGEAKPFNPNQFFYSGLDTTVTDPHGKPWILPTLDTAPAQAKMRNTLHKVMVHQGWARLAASVNWEKVMANMPAEANTAAKKRTYMRGVINDITNQLRQLRPDDAAAVYDFIDLKVLGAQHGSQSLSTAETADLYDVDNAAAAKTPPSALGRSSGTALSTNADIHWWIYALAIEAMRRHVLRGIEWCLSQYLKIRGIPAYAVLEASPIRKTDEKVEEEAAEIRQRRLVQALDYNLVDADTVRSEMGYPAMQDAATAAGGAERATRDGEGAAIVATVMTTCTKCGTANLRRRNGQGKCRSCGAYLQARRAAVMAPDPDITEAVLEVAGDLQVRSAPSDLARGYIEAYSDAIEAQNLDDVVACAECAPAESEADRAAEKVKPEGTRVYGAIELGQEFAFPGNAEADEARDAWREWAGRRAKQFTALLDATQLDEDDERGLRDDLIVRAEDLAARRGWSWDARIQRYRTTEGGRQLSDGEMGRLLERRMADHRKAIDELADRVSSGRITVAEFQQGLAKATREVHLQARMLGVGGRENMTPRHYGSVGGYMRFDTDRIARFGNDIQAEKLSAAQIKNRARMYGEANIRRDYDRGRQWSHEEQGYSQERRVLRSDAAHCEGCKEEARRGYVAIGELAPIGGHECGGNDKCQKTYRYSSADQFKPRRAAAPGRIARSFRVPAGAR